MRRAGGREGVSGLDWIAGAEGIGEGVRLI